MNSSPSPVSRLLPDDELELSVIMPENVPGLSSVSCIVALSVPLVVDVALANTTSAPSGCMFALGSITVIVN